eukprot:863-Heterococcus_DN1.PRE.1
MVQSRDVERAAKSFVMVHVQASGSPLGIDIITKPLKDLNLCAVYGHLPLKHHAGMRFLHGEFEETARQLAHDQKERVADLEKQITYLTRFTDTGVSPEQQQQFQRLRKAAAKHHRMIAEYFYSLYLKREDMKEAIFMDKMAVVRRNARVWEQQYKELATQMLLKEAGFELLRQRNPEATEEWLCHLVRHTIWRKHKELEAGYRQNRSFMAVCSAEADRWLKHSLQGELADQFLAKCDPLYRRIKREYYTSRPDFEAPDHVVHYVQHYDAETGLWKGPTEEEVLDEYIDTLEEAAVAGGKQALKIACNEALNSIPYGKSRDGLRRLQQQ